MRVPRIGRLILLALALLAGAASLTCSPVYVIRAGIQEARILSRRRPIKVVIDDPGTTPEVRGKLELVLQARTFAQKVLHLDAGDSFTTYSWVRHDTLLMVLSASQKLAFQPYTWWFPIVGRVPYKGYFNFPAAYREAAKLTRKGYDTYVRPSGAFSTLGWFNDPLLNTVLRYDDVSLASTVIHELTHNTIFIPSQISFNESFANFVGDRGAALFFCSRDGESAHSCQLARDVWHDNLVFGAFLTHLVAQLDSIYAHTNLPDSTRLVMRAETFQDARRQFQETVEPQLATNLYRGFGRSTINNATLIGIRLYYDRLDLFEKVYQSHGGDLVAAVGAIANAARQDPDHAFQAVARLTATAAPDTTSGPLPGG